jgi:hypothetical protein
VEKIRKEVDAVAGDDFFAPFVPSYEQIKNMKYTHNVFTEVSRYVVLFLPAAVFGLEI